MNKSKKLTAAVAASAVASALVAPAAFAATELTDIDGSFAKDAIKELVDKGIINGKGDGKFDPTGKIERQDFAIILAKALGLDVASAPATATFSDVPTTDYSFKYVEAAAKAGLIKGEGEGKFGAGSNLSRQDMAVLFVRALGEDVTGKGKDLKFSDAGEIADYAKDAVAAAVELGLIAGNPDGTFDPNGNAERQAVALVASKFLKAKAELSVATLTGATATDSNTISLTFSKALDKDLVAADVKVADKASGAAVTVSNVLTAADKKSATVKVNTLAAGTTYTVTVGNKTVDVTTGAKVEVATVSAVNLKQVKVEFTGAVNADTVVKENFLVDNVAKFKSAVVLDEKTAILTLNDDVQFKNQTSYDITVNGLKDAAGLSLTKVVKTIVPFDNAVPVAKEVKVMGPHTLRVYFSAPVAESVTDATYSLDNGTVYAGPEVAAKISGTSYYVNLHVGTDLAEGSHTLVVAGQKGFNDLKVEKSTLNFDYAKDTVAPTVEVSSVKLYNDTDAQGNSEIVSKVTFKFSEPVQYDASTNELENSKLYALYDGVDQNKAKTVQVDFDNAKLFTEDGKTYADTFVATFRQVFPTGAVNFYVKNEDDTYKISDAWGNEFTNATATGTNTVDNVSPTVTVASATDQSAVAVDFSEDVNNVQSGDSNWVYSANNYLNYTFYNADGTVLKGNSLGLDGAGHPLNVAYDPAKKRTNITKLNLPAGNVVLKVNNLKDIAVPAANQMAEATLNLVVENKVAPKVDGAIFTADQKSLFLHFSKAMDAASITDLHNYAIKGNLLTGTAYKDVTVTATAIDNNRGVKLSFSETNADLIDQATLTYGHLKDSTGNYTDALTTDFKITADTITMNNIMNVKAVSKDTVTFEVNQRLSKVNTDLIKINGQKAYGGFISYQQVVNPVTGAVSDGTLVTVRLASADAAYALYTDGTRNTDLIADNVDLLTIEKNGNLSALTNVNGNVLADTVSLAYGDTSAQWGLADGIAPTLVSAAHTDNGGVAGELDAIEVTFSEAMDSGSISADSFAVAGYTVKTVYANTNNGASDKFTILVKESGYNDMATKPLVTLQKDAKDASGNKIVAGKKVNSVKK